VLLLDQYVPEVPTTQEIELQQLVYREIQIACHEWSSGFGGMHPRAGASYLVERGLERGRRGEDYEADVWDDLTAISDLPYNEENWRRMRPMFVDGLNRFHLKLQDMLSAHSGELTNELKTLIVRTQREMAHHQSNYLRIPTFPLDRNRYFVGQLQAPLKTLGGLCREVNSLFRQLPN